MCRVPDLLSLGKSLEEETNLFAQFILVVVVPFASFCFFGVDFCTAGFTLWGALLLPIAAMDFCFAGTVCFAWRKQDSHVDG